MVGKWKKIIFTLYSWPLHNMEVRGVDPHIGENTRCNFWLSPNLTTVSPSYPQIQPTANHKQYFQYALGNLWLGILQSETSIANVKILFLIWRLIKSSGVKPADRKGQLHLLKKIYMYKWTHTFQICVRGWSIFKKSGTTGKLKRETVCICVFMCVVGSDWEYQSHLRVCCNISGGKSRMN